MEGAALQDQATPPVGPALPDPAPQWGGTLVKDCQFGLLAPYYPRGFMGLFNGSLVIWDFIELHQI